MRRYCFSLTRFAKMYESLYKKTSHGFPLSRRRMRSVLGVLVQRMMRKVLSVFAAKVYSRMLEFGSGSTFSQNSKTCTSNIIGLGAMRVRVSHLFQSVYIHSMQPTVELCRELLVAPSGSSTVAREYDLP